MLESEISFLSILKLQLYKSIHLVFPLTFSA